VPLFWASAGAASRERASRDKIRSERESRFIEPPWRQGQVRETRADNLVQEQRMAKASALRMPGKKLIRAGNNDFLERTPRIWGAIKLPIH
jgi:hypothetical protein